MQLHMTVRAYPANDPPNTTSAVFSFGNPNTTDVLSTVINPVFQSVMIARPKVQQTTRIMATDATFIWAAGPPKA